MKQRIFAALLACALLTGCGAVRTAPVVMASREEDGRVRLAYVPLDDRPDNVSRVVYLAESLDYRLVMPEENLYKTRLDHQPAPEGRQCGDPWLLYQWVLEQEAEGCDRYILSLDQLLSGGLVNSRCESSQVIIKPDGETVSVTHFLTELLLNLAADQSGLAAGKRHAPGPDGGLWGRHAGRLQLHTRLRHGAAENACRRCVEYSQYRPKLLAGPSGGKSL